MNKSFPTVLLTCLFLITSPPAIAATPFEMNLTFQPSTKTLRIDIERLSKDEVQHAYQKIIIYKNGVNSGVVDLSAQNYSNRILKDIVLDVEREDELSVELIYGKGESLIKPVVIDKILNIRKTALPANRSKSILVSDEKIDEGYPKPALNPKETSLTDRSKFRYGYTKEDKRRSADSFGYKLDPQEYGYSVDENKLSSPSDHGHRSTYKK